ncbi:MAG: CAP domain-containing protein [Lachnospiraceae bacterium]
MKNIIKNFLIKKVMIGGMSVKAGTIATAAVVTTLAVGGTTVAVTSHTFDAEDAIVEEVTDFAESIIEQDNTETQEVINKEESSLVTYEDKNENSVVISEEDIHIHTFLTQVIEEPTCQITGSAYDYCSECGYTSATYTLPVNNNHVIDDQGIVTEAATCEKDGYKVYTCSVCGEIIEYNVIAPLGHDYGEPVVTDSTCYAEGNRKYTCQRENCNYSYEEVIAKKDHTESDWIENNPEVDKAPTCTEAGKKHTECTECHAIMRTETIPAVGHSFVNYEVITPATDLAEGLERAICENGCGEQDRVIVPKTNHANAEWKITKEATYTEMGLKEKICPDCHVTLETENIPVKPHEHDYQITSSTDATCTEEGNTVKTCSVCGNTTTITIPAIGHDYGDWIIDTEAGEGTEGSKHKECSRCDSTITEDVDPLPPHVHSYSETSGTDSTCSIVGSVTYTCSCGDSYSEEIAKKEHTPGEWTVKTPATEEAAGLEVRTCTVCGMETDSKVLDKLPHTHNYTTESKAATCTEDGYEKQTCACGSVINTVIPATGHDAGEWTIVREAEIGVTGLKELRCTECNAPLDTEEIPMLITDGTDSIYYFTVKNEDGTYRQEMVIGHYNEDEAMEMLALVNQYREENGLTTFTMNSIHQKEYAALRAVETSYLWDHARPSGAGCECAENIAMGGPDGHGNTPTVQAIFDAWVASPGHKENLDATRIYNVTGISVFYKKCPVYNSEGEVVRYAYIAYWVETFR